MWQRATDICLIAIAITVGLAVRYCYWFYTLSHLHFVRIIYR